MRLRASLLFVLAVTVFVWQRPPDAQNLKQVGTIPIPGNTINPFGSLRSTRRAALAISPTRTTRASVFDTKTDTYVSRISGFVGMTKSGNTSGPNGMAVVNDGAEIWVSDGDSTIKVIDPRPAAITGDDRDRRQGCAQTAWPSIRTAAWSSSPTQMTSRRSST